MVRRRIDPKIHQALLEYALAATPLSGGQVHELLEERFGKDAISTRTVQRILSELRPAGPAGEGVWRIEDAESDAEAVAVLDVIRVLSSIGRPVLIPRETAEWIAAVRRAAPDLDPYVSLQVATVYKYAREDGRHTADLDAYLAHAPWRSAERAAAYEAAVAQGLPRFMEDWS